MTFEQFIADQGTQAVADKLGVTNARVRLWKHRRCVPREFWGQLLHAFPSLTREGLIGMELARQSA